MRTHSYETTIGGKTLSAELSDLAENANGSILLRYGDTVILVTAVMGAEAKPGMGYFPLSVEFEERFYAAGQILGSRFMRREGRPSDEAILSARIVDRTIRPLFAPHIRQEVQVVVTVLALGDDDPDTLAVIGASLALSISDIPWNGPVGAVRIGKHTETGELIVNPTYIERAAGALECEVLACGKDGAINMIETAGNEVAETAIVEVLETAVEIHGAIEKFQKEILAAISPRKRELPPPAVTEEMATLFSTVVEPRLHKHVFPNTPGKESIHALKKEWLAACAELAGASEATAEDLFEQAVDSELHRGVCADSVRADGRALDEVRPLYAQAGRVSDILHGVGIFYRGGTHILSALTLGGPQDSQILDTIEERETHKRFMHHYNFPPFSVGESGRVGGFNRRMIGHGALAEKALEPVIPTKEAFPYTIRLVSETLASNGSSSMGSVCASTLALMDGGVPITRPVAGIALGLFMAADGTYKILTDIQGPEDEHGDMDFKVAGTREGITAMQMDVKIDGVPITILAEALERAKEARLHILDVIEKEIAAPRADISTRAPKIISLHIDPKKIGAVIGSGGKTVNKMKEDTGVTEISIEDDGTIFITGAAGTAEAAAAQIEALTHDFEIGEEMTGKIVRLAPFGAFVALNAHTDGLVHVSEIAPFRIEQVEDVLAIGEDVPVVVTKVEEGKIGLSIKQRDAEYLTRKGITPPAA